MCKPAFCVKKKEQSELKELSSMAMTGEENFLPLSGTKLVLHIDGLHPKLVYPHNQLHCRQVQNVLSSHI